MAPKGFLDIFLESSFISPKNKNFYRITTIKDIRLYEMSCMNNSFGIVCMKKMSSREKLKTLLLGVLIDNTTVGINNGVERQIKYEQI